MGADNGDPSGSEADEQRPSEGALPAEKSADTPEMVRSREQSSSGARRTGSRPRRSLTTPVSQGQDFERRVARMEFAEGALARLRVPVLVDAESGKDVLTDLDVLALDLDNRLRLSRSILECKSGAGQSGEGDRLLWLSGLRSFVGVERAVLVRQSVTRRGQGLAAALDLQILDAETLTTREVANGWIPERFAHIDGQACTAAETRMDTQLKALGHVPAQLVAFLRFKSLLAPAHRILSALVEYSGIADRGGALPEPTRTLLASHALMALTMAAVQDAAALDTMSVQLLGRRTELALTVGSPDGGQLLSVLGLSDQIMVRTIDQVHRAYTQQGADRIDVPTPSLRAIVASPPVWIDRYLSLVQRLRSTPAIAAQILQTVELACFDALLGGTAYHASAFDHLFTPEHRSLLSACARMLREIVTDSTGDALNGLAGLDFNRSAPLLPDRAAAPKSDGQPQAALWTTDSN